MATATISTILDRMAAIHATISGVTTSRYAPRNYDTAKLPLLTTYPTTGVRERLYEQHARVTRTFLILAIIGDFERGIPGESAMRNAEALVEDLEDAYNVRDRLQLDGDILVGLISAQLGSDSGIVERGGLAVIEFPLIVIYDQDVTPL